MQTTNPAQCTVPRKKPPVDRSRRLTLKCKFNRRCFDVKFMNDVGLPTNLEDLVKAIERETGIPPPKQCILLKGMKMDPPDLKSMTTLDNLNVKTGDQVLILTKCRVAPDDEEKEAFEQLLSRVKVTNGEISELFYTVDRVEHGCFPKGRGETALKNLRSRAICLEKTLMGFIETANGIHLDYRNAVDLARRRQMVDECQRQMDKVGEVASAIFDRLALGKASLEGISLYTIPTKQGPCNFSDGSFKGPCQ